MRGKKALRQSEVPEKRSAIVSTITELSIRRILRMAGIVPAPGIPLPSLVAARDAGRCCYRVKATANVGVAMACPPSWNSLLLRQESPILLPLFNAIRPRNSDLQIRAINRQLRAAGQYNLVKTPSKETQRNFDGIPGDCWRSPFLVYPGNPDGSCGRRASLRIAFRRLRIRRQNLQVSVLLPATPKVAVMLTLFPANGKDMGRQTFRGIGLSRFQYYLQ